MRSRVRWFLTDGLPILLGLGVLPAALVAAFLGFPVLHRLAHVWSCGGGAEGAPAWSPDGRRIAFAVDGSCDTEIVTVGPDGSQRRVVTRELSDWPSWSADGRSLLVDTGDGFALVSARGGRPRTIVRGESDEGAAASPDGSQLAFTHGFLPSMGGDYQSTLYLRQAGGTVRPLLGHACDPGTPAWSPDGSAIAVGCADGLYVVDPRSGVSRRIWKISFGWEPPRPAWSPDGTRVAYVDADGGALDVGPADGSRPPHAIVSVDSHGWSDAAAWSPDGRRLVYSQSAGAATDGIYVVRADGDDPHRIARL